MVLIVNLEQTALVIQALCDLELVNSLYFVYISPVFSCQVTYDTLLPILLMGVIVSYC